MTTTRDILTGYAALIAGAGIGVWNPAGVYQTTDTGIFLKTMPDGTTVPDRCVVLNVIPLTDDIVMPQGRVLIQVAGRGARNNPLDVDDILDPIMNLFQGRTNDVFGSTTVIQLFRQGSVPMGADDLWRWTRADKYFADLGVAPTSLRPAGGAWD